MTAQRKAMETSLMRYRTAVKTGRTAEMQAAALKLAPTTTSLLRRSDALQKPGANAGVVPVAAGTSPKTKF